MKHMAWLSVPAVLAVAGVVVWRSNASASASTGSHRPLYYVDPMHPAYRSATPGIAPDCGMRLTPVYAEDLEGQSTPSAPAAPVTIGSEVRQRYGIKLATVENSSGRESFHAYGRVTADETRIYRVSLGTDGYVKGTLNDAVGSHVARNQHLAVVYSPEFLSVAGGFLSANERTPGGSSKDAAAMNASQNASSAAARADRLRNLGMSDVQIEELSSTRKIPEDVYVVSPVDGYILSRDISSGMRFEKHAEFYKIADLSSVWIVTEAYSGGSALFKPGSVARVTVPDTQQSFVAKVKDVLPEIDAETRALKPRLELSNSGLHLRPGMYVDVEVDGSSRQGLSVPSEAVLNTGSSSRVFVQTARNTFEPRVVETGWTADDRTQIIKGVKEGDQIIASGTFLLDSEASMHPR